MTQELDESLISMYAGVILAIARMESGNPERPPSSSSQAAGGEAMPLVPGGLAGEVPRAADALPAAARPASTRPSGRPASRAAVAAATGLGTAPPGPSGRPRAWRSPAATRPPPPSARSRRPPPPRRPGPLVEAAVSRLLAGRALAQAGERDRAVAELERAVAVLDACGADR